MTKKKYIYYIVYQGFDKYKKCQVNGVCELKLEKSIKGMGDITMISDFIKTNFIKTYDVVDVLVVNYKLMRRGK